MTVQDPVSNPVTTPSNETGATTPPPTQSLEERISAAEAKANDAYAKLRMKEKEFATVKAKVDALESGATKFEAEKINSLRLKMAYENGIPSDMFPLVTGNTEDEIRNQISILQDRLLRTADAPLPANSGGSTTTQPAASTTQPRPAPVSQGGPSWLEKYQSADLETRAKMDRDVANGLVKPW